MVSIFSVLKYPPVSTISTLSFISSQSYSVGITAFPLGYIAASYWVVKVPVHFCFHIFVSLGLNCQFLSQVKLENMKGHSGLQTILY
jgi:hypothetical protein